MPRLPQYLPRPLPPTADDELQRRLLESEDPLQRGLLLMRRTGLRLGELAGLAHDCVRRDENGNVFLKVPLGKMHNERLVPMDPATATIAEKLRAEGRTERPLLLETVRGKRTRRWHYMRALGEASEGLDLSEKLTSHRLRHTYATTLMNGGMSLMGVMKLLGHRDYRMTLRYTEITLETVGDEYYAALTKLEQRYRIAIKSAPEAGIDPDEMLDDVIRWSKKRGAENPDANSRTQALIKRPTEFVNKFNNLSRTTSKAKLSGKLT